MTNVTLSKQPTYYTVSLKTTYFDAGFVIQVSAKSICERSETSKRSTIVCIFCYVFTVFTARETPEYVFLM